MGPLPILYTLNPAHFTYFIFIPLSTLATPSKRKTPADGVRIQPVKQNSRLTKKQIRCTRIKLLIDIPFSFLLIVFLSPILLLLFLINLFASKGHPLFFQVRCGRNEKPFHIVKFRTMKLDVPSYVTSEELGDSAEYFGFGHVLKKSHLDELPQLFNILLGQMAFVGPRPGLFNDTPLIEYRKENGTIGLRPGLTGLAQIAADDQGPLSQKEKSIVDKRYMENMSIWLDVKIFFLTFSKVFRNITRKRKWG